MAMWYPEIGDDTCQNNLAIMFFDGQNTLLSCLIPVGACAGAGRLDRKDAPRRETLCPGHTFIEVDARGAAASRPVGVT